MTKYVAFLRGITPSDPKMQNEKLRDLFQTLGFSNVRTVISSGNVLFETPSTSTNALEALIEGALPDKLGLRSTTIVYSQEELQQLVHSKPFGRRQESPGARFHVTFLKTTPNVGTFSGGIIGVHGRAMCMVVDLTAMKTPEMMLWMERQFGKEITTRTWKTVNRILKSLKKNGEGTQDDVPATCGPVTYQIPFAYFQTTHSWPQGDP